MRQAIVIGLALAVVGAAGYLAMRRPLKPAAPPTKPSEAAKPEENAKPSAPAPDAPKPPPGPSTKPPEPEKRDYPAELAGTTRIADILAKEPPRGPQNYNAMMDRCRALLKDPTSNAVFLADLPSLTQRQLVIFWDVLWLTGDYQKQGFGAFGDDFARAITRRLAELMPTWTDSTTRQLVCNMLLPDLKYLSDDELARVKALLAADPDESLRKKADLFKR